MKTTKTGNPKDLYPVPPFPKQDQSPPGVNAKMSPVPDHGEASYEGSEILLNKVAIITGGDSGIGKAVAIAMAREGADVVISYKDEMEDDDAADTKMWIERAGRKALLFRGDIRDEDLCKKIVEEAASTFGKIDILVNNAAYQMSFDQITDISAAEWNKTFETNMSAMFYFVKHAKAHMPPGGSIINTTSVNAYKPNPSLVPYAATKGAIQNFTSSLAQLFLEDGSGIRVNAVAPGPVWTPLIPSTIPDHENFGENTPMGRPGQPAEMAPIYVFLASDAASYVSGATIPATGGRATI
ncbi:SDR family oxidoreductase [Sphingobacterium oryzagri]|uniref:SDR family oxidoreductase n=1 Tax=Sphingobacterium oryzagri TaxID=3025669 RepID=A0ABY7WF69_9SPHI|nr:SDR family oxidoreductase [Sphingobacterium sp. KACC 22765]WDF67254.1 SDR family oxidoreductase [Sphingobacterium sp. KACC 22765]